MPALKSLSSFILALVLFFGFSFSYESQCEDARGLPGIYGVLGVVPGLGHVVQGHPMEGLGWFGTSVLMVGSGDPHLAQIGFDLWMYNMYDAYRDAGAAHAAKHNVIENYISNFIPTNILDPIGAPIVGVGMAAGSKRGYPTLQNPVSVIEYTFVGLGEEALFRGFLFPGLSSIFAGSRIMGALSSSAIFAAAHNNPNPMAFGVRFIGGLLFCWQVKRNNYDLRKNIFAHSWYDIFVSGPAKVPVYALRFNSAF